jgi:ribonuclease HI
MKNTFQTNDSTTVIINQIRKLKNLYKNVKLKWKPGHCKINWNELADQHAEIATLFEAPKQKYSTIIDTKNHFNTEHKAKTLGKP